MDAKFFLPLFLILVSVPMVSADFCIDQIPPSAPSNLVITGSPYDADGNISLSWTAATDLPECGGIDHYNIYRSDNNTNFTMIGTSGTTGYDDLSSLPEGTYYYRVTAVDTVEFMPHEGPAAEGSTIVGQAPPSPPGGGDDDDDDGGGGGGGSSGGGGGTVTTPPEEEECNPVWRCTSWSECIDGTQKRDCTDINECDDDSSRPSEKRSCGIESVLPSECEEGDTACVGDKLFVCNEGNDWDQKEVCEFGCSEGACLEGPEDEGNPITGMLLSPVGFYLGLLVLVLIIVGGALYFKKR